MDADIDQRIAWQKEDEEKLKAWEENRKAEAERKAREERQGRLNDYLARRTEAWADHVGSLPPSSLISKWREAYIETVVSGQDLDLELRQARAAAESPW